MRGVQAVVHLAALNENDSLADPAAAIRINTLGTWLALQAALAAGVSRFLYFSTAHVYGAPLQGRITEQTLPRPVHPYAATHRAAEDLVLAARDQGKTDGIVVRLSNGFGAPTHAGVDRWTLLVNDLCRQAAGDRRLVLRSSGTQLRDFIPLKDVGRAVIHLLALETRACGDGIFNLGGRTASIWEMTQLVAARCEATLEFRPEIVRPAPKAGEIAAPLHYDCTRLLNTGFSLQGQAEEEVDATLRLCARALR
jgi:UDP-glucose 4-epimerase